MTGRHQDAPGEPVSVSVSMSEPDVESHVFLRTVCAAFVPIMVATAMMAMVSRHRGRSGQETAKNNGNEALDGSTFSSEHGRSPFSDRDFG
jgi:hypothetical protein